MIKASDSKVPVLRQVTRSTAIAVLLLGSVVLLGWLTGLQSLMTILPNWVAMKSNTAASFILAALSLYLMAGSAANSPPRVWQRVAAFFAALIVVDVGVMTQLEYLLHWNLGLDEILFRDAVEADLNYFPGRMSPITATNFICVGAALVVLAINRAVFLARALIGCVVFLTLIVVTGAAYGLQSMLASGHYTSVALHTNFGFVLLCLGIFCASGEGKLMNLITDSSAAGQVARRLLPASVLVPLAISWASAAAERHHLIELELAVSIFCISTIVAFTFLVWWSATYLQKSEQGVRVVDAKFRDSLQRYHFLAEAMPQIVWTAKPDGSVDYFNQRWFDYTGISLEQAIDWGWKPVLHPDDVETCLEHWNNSIKTGANYEVEYRFRRKDGVYRWQLGRAFPLRDEMGQIVQWVGTCTDIDDQKQARTNLEGLIVERTREVASAKEKLQAVLDAATQVSIIASEPEGKITVFNSGAEKMLGYAASEVLGKTPALFHLESEVVARGEELSLDLSRTIQGFDVFIEAARKGQHEEREWTYIRKDGRKLTVNLMVTASRDEDGEIDGFLGIATDITARKQAEDTLRLSEQRFRLFVDAVEDYALLMLDPQGTVISWNVGAERIKGYKADEIIGRSFSCFYLPEAIAAGHPEKVMKIAAQEGRYTEEGWRVRKDGSRFWADVVLTAIHDQAGVLRGFAKVTRDITARKQVEKTLRDQALILDLANDTIFIRDKDDRIIYWNQGAERLYGWTKEEAMGKVTHDLFETKFPRSLKSIQTQLKASGHWEGELIHLRRDGRLVTVASSWTLQRDEAGKPVSVIEMNYDITARKQAEEALAQSRQRLNAILDSSLDGVIVYDAVRDNFGKVQDLRFAMINPAAEKLMGMNATDLIGHSLLNKFPSVTTDGIYEKFVRIVEDGVNEEFEHKSTRLKTPRWYRIAGVKLGDGLVISYTEITVRKNYERELHAAKERAELADRAKSDFLASMSHEIRTPMNGVLGMTGLLLDTGLDNEQRSLAETIRVSAESLLGLINDILDFSKIEAGKLSFEELDFNLRKVVEDSLEMMAGQAAIKGIDLVGDVELGMPTKLRGDPGRVHQVLTNLIGNAIKFTRVGEVVVRAKTEVETANDVLVRFEIKDTGIGISAETRDRLFQPFVQADSSTSRKFGGTGLGLVICKRLAEAMHGSIGADSVPGEGSTFWVTLRFQRQLEAPLEPQPAPEVVGARVLVVDDNETSRRLLHNQVVAWRMRNGSAATCEEALAMLRQAVADGSPYQVAIIDSQMPGTDGVALARQMNADPKLAATRIIMLTPLGKPSADFKSIDVAASCAKPVRQSALFDSIAQVLVPAANGALPAASKSITRSKTLVAKRKERILLAEDNVVNQRVALGNLRKLGFEADVVANGFEVLEATARKTYDIILMDCQMPELDGYEVTRELRDRERSGHRTWIIAMTANVMVGDREKCLAAGMDDYVGKPLRRPELRAALDRFPGESRAAPDQNLLLNFGGEGEGIDLEELIDLFIESAPKSIEDMKRALEANSAKDLSFAAHTLKGSCGNLGKFPLHEICVQLEQAGRSGDIRGTDDLVASAENELRRLILTLQSHKKAKPE